MGLEIIYGLTKSGKTDFCFEQIEKILNQSKSKVIYMVPEQFSLQSERNIVTKFGGGISTRIDVLSFERLAQQVFAKYGPFNTEYITSTGRQIVMQKALLDTSNKLKAFTLSCENIDFANTLIETKAEFKRYCVDIEKITNLPINNELLKLKLNDISIIFKKHSELLSNKYSDNEDNLNLLCKKISDLKLFNDYIFILNKFNDFTEQELHVIQELLIHSKQVSVAITTDSISAPDNYGELFKLPKNTIARLFDIAYKNKIDILPNKYIKKPQTNNLLELLEKKYFDYSSDISEQTVENIRVFYAKNRYSEIHAVAKHIVALIKDEKMRYRDISIITRNMEEYAEHFRDIFSQYNIPIFIDERKNALHCPLTQYVLSVLEILVYNWNQASIFKYLKSDFSLIPASDVQLLENYCLAVGLTRQQWLSDEDLTFTPKSFSNEDMARVNEVKKHCISPIIQLSKSFNASVSASQMIFELFSLLQESKIRDVVYKRHEILLENGLIEQAAHLEQSYNAILEVLEQIHIFFGDNVMNIEKSYALFKSGLSSITLAQIPTTVDQVQLSRIDIFRSPGPRCLMIVGVNDGVLPCGNKNEGLLSDSERHLLSEHHINLAQDMIARQFNEQLVVHKCITAPTEKLFLYSPVATGEGDSLTPSPILDRIKYLFPNMCIESDLYTAKEAIDHIAPSDYTNQADKIGGEITNRLLSDSFKASVSQLEQYSSCPFSYFMKYILRVNPRLRHKIDAPDIGNFMHEIIEHFSNYASELDNGWLELERENLNVKLSELTDVVLNNRLGEAINTSPRFNRLSSKLQRILRSTLWNVAEFYRHSTFTPIGYELRFDTYLPVQINNSKLNVNLVGKIDRVDVYHTDDANYISVVDYKSGAKDIEYSSILAGTQLQLPMYLKSICAEYEKKYNTPSIPAAMLYYKIDSPIIESDPESDSQTIWNLVQKELKMNGLILDDFEITEELNSKFIKNSKVDLNNFKKIYDFAENKSEEIIKKIFNGYINISPCRSSKKCACDFCKYKTICKFDPKLIGNKFNYIPAISKDEFLEKINIK